MAKHVAASASNADVLTLVPLVAADTDDRIDVVIPDGNPHWTEVVDFVMPDTAKRLFIHGAGNGADDAPDGGGDKTVIFDDRTANDTPILIVTPNSREDGIARAFGLTFTQTNRSRGLGSLNISGHYKDPVTPQRFRVDHCTFNAKSRGLGFGGRVIGVADRLLFNSEAATSTFFNSYSDGQGDVVWSEDTGLGTLNFPVIEDCVFKSIGSATINDSYRGSKFVVRFCDSERAALQTHPTGGSNRARGSRAWEIYGVRFRNANAQKEYNFFFLSSATGMLHFNDVEGVDNFITSRVNRRDGVPYLQAPTPDGWGYAGTSKTGVGSNWDGNQDKTTGYPALDQVGRGKGDLLVGDFGAGMVNQATGKNFSDPGAYPRQALEPIYVFGNIYVGNLWTDAGQGGVIMANRDYFLDTGGRLGKGLVLPTAAGLPWDGFVKLDGGSWLKKTPGHGVTTIPNFMLFVRSAENLMGVWQPYYQPLEYPHPFIALTKYDDGPIVIPTDPPVPDEPAPIPNAPPTVKITSPADGAVITVKSQNITVLSSDDTGVTWLELWINDQMVKQAATTTMSYSWNTSPYKGKGTVTIKAIARDADKELAQASIQCTVKK